MKANKKDIKKGWCTQNVTPFAKIERITIQNKDHWQHKGIQIVVEKYHLLFKFKSKNLFLIIICCSFFTTNCYQRNIIFKENPYWINNDIEWRAPEQFPDYNTHYADGQILIFLPENKFKKYDQSLCKLKNDTRIGFANDGSIDYYGEWKKEKATIYLTYKIISSFGVQFIRKDYTTIVFQDTLKLKLGSDKKLYLEYKNEKYIPHNNFDEEALINFKLIPKPAKP